MSDSKLVCHFCGHHDPTATLGVRCPADGSVLVPAPEHSRCPDDQILGRVVGGKYAVIGQIGAGAMGAVYRALQEPVGREVALKVIRHGVGNDENLRARFIREAKTVARLSNPSTVMLIDYGFEPDGVLYMVLELVRGRRLTEALNKEGVFTPARIVPIACQVLNALAEAHGLGLVHRDIKPDNVMLVRGPWGEEQAKVLDFGIAKVRTDDGDHNLKTQAGVVLGTPLYMAPEQATERGVDGRADLYAVGVVLYQALSGHLPFTAPTVFEVLLAHRESPVPPFPESLGIPPALEAVVRKALEKRPEDRFGDAASMAQALLAAIPTTATATTGAAAISQSQAALARGRELAEIASADTVIPSRATPIPLTTPVAASPAASNPAGAAQSSPAVAAQPSAAEPVAPSVQPAQQVAAAAAEPAPPTASANATPVVAGPAAPSVSPTTPSAQGPALPNVPRPAPKKTPGWVLPVVLGGVVLLIGIAGVAGWFLLRGGVGNLMSFGGTTKPTAPLKPDTATLALIDPNAQKPAGGETPEGANTEPGPEDAQPPETAGDDGQVAAAGEDAGADEGAAAAEPDAGEATVAANDTAADSDDSGQLTERVLFEDDFKRSDFHLVGGRWREYQLRQKRAAYALQQGESDWVVRASSLSIRTQAWQSGVEDVAVTEDEFPVESTRVEFEMRGRFAGIRQNGGALGFWVADPAKLNAGLAKSSQDLIGFGWVMPTNAPVLQLFAAGEVQEQPGRRPGGFDPAAWVRHAITVRGGVMTYQIGDEAPVTVKLVNPPAPDARRRFAFAIRAYEQVWHMVDVRNFRIVALEPAAK